MPKVIINKKPKKEYKNIALRLSVEEYEKLKKEADKENRNTTNFILNCVKNYLANK